MRGRLTAAIAAGWLVVLPLASRAPRDPWVTLDARRTLPGQQASYLRFLAENWVPAREEAARGGAVVGHDILVRDPSDAAPGGWDILLVTVYRDSLAAATAEEIFRPIIAAREMVRIEGLGPRELAIGLWSTTLRQVVSRRGPTD